MRPTLLPLALVIGLLAATVAACDSGISGTPNGNQPPVTTLSVRDTSLVGQIDEADRLSSAVNVAWTGTDADGFVVAFELRYYAQGDAPGPWIRTSRQDTVLVLPVRGQSTANVAVEVRAIDNDGAVGLPARTVFPIRNAPPTLALSRFERPPDTTFTIATFAFDARDPEGDDNLAAIEVALNDTAQTFTLPPSARIITLVGGVNRADAGQTIADAQVYLGRTFQSAGVTLPGLRLDADNVLYVRAVDQAGAKSALARYPAENAADARWYVKKPRARVLLVNDFRRQSAPLVLAWHANLLREQTGEAPDVWTINTPYTTGSTGNVGRSPLVGATAEPWLAETMALYDHIYWVATASTNSAALNNLPFVVPSLDKFFEAGGTMLVHSPVSLPPSDQIEENLNNPALFLLPISGLALLPDSLRPALNLSTGADVVPAQPLPGGAALPALRARSFVATALPFDASGTGLVPLYRAAFTYRTTAAFGNRSGLWTGASVVAAMRLDAQGQPSVGFMALPLVNESTGQPIFTGADGAPGAAADAVRLMLQSLGF